MTTKANPTEERGATRTSHAGVICEFSQIEEQGCYVTQNTGRLLRVPSDALSPGRSPLIATVGRNPWLVTKISDDPYAPLSTARMAAADLDLRIDF